MSEKISYYVFGTLKDKSGGMNTLLATRTTLDDAIRDAKQRKKFEEAVYSPELRTSDLRVEYYENGEDKVVKI